MWELEPYVKGSLSKLWPGAETVNVPRFVKRSLRGSSSHILTFVSSLRAARMLDLALELRPMPAVGL